MKMTTLLAIFLLTICQACTERDAEVSDIPTVGYIIAKGQDIPIRTTLPGRVTALSVSEVRPQVDGIILERLFNEGDDVRKNQPLYQIDSAIYKANCDIAKANLEEAMAREEVLKHDVKRERKLQKANAVSQKDFDNTLSSFRQAQALVAKAKAELERAEINLAYTTIRAHTSGRIGFSEAWPGTLVTANQIKPLALIQQINQVYVDLTRPSADILRLREEFRRENNPKKNNVKLMLENGLIYTKSDKSPICGKLLFSDISVGKDTGSVALRAIFENYDNILLPGMYVSAIIEDGIYNNAILVPQQSVMSQGNNSHFVYILKNEGNKFIVEKREVQLERTYGNFWIIRQGIKAGDFVVVSGTQYASPGKIVDAADEGDIYYKHFPDNNQVSENGE